MVIAICTYRNVFCVEDPPFIRMSPCDQFVLLGDNVVFSMEASGFEITYQWLFNGMQLGNSIEGVSGVNSPNLTITNVTEANFGYYSCVVSNVVASRSSDNATLQLCELTSLVYMGHWHLVTRSLVSYCSSLDHLEDVKDRFNLLFSTTHSPSPYSDHHWFSC